LLLKGLKWLSLIVEYFPPPFEEFHAKRFNPLWRGSRDRVTAQEFHFRCDGRANTLTLMADTDEHIFGGFTPVEWESSAPGAKYRHMKGHRAVDGKFAGTGGVMASHPFGHPPERYEISHREQSEITALIGAQP
jgi:hypothetical protein